MLILIQPRERIWYPMIILVGVKFIKKQEAKLFNDNEIEVNNKNINTENGQRQNTSIKHRDDTVSPRTSKYRVIIGTK